MLCRFIIWCPTRLYIPKVSDTLPYQANIITFNLLSFRNQFIIQSSFFVIIIPYSLHYGLWSLFPFSLYTTAGNTPPPISQTIIIPFSHSGQ